ncbi:MAG: thioredoxin domain-containing protein [Acidimicrobiales bacterium]
MNRLATASSAYLRQHADNPVDWWPWGPAALERARALDRPIFLSVGYAACHWCHVMAHESFENPEIAQLLNDEFVAIKVDREERPDVDAVYMAATQVMNGNGGWPMSVFLLPDTRPFMAGTYYPPVDRHGQVGFGRLLRALSDAWRDQRATVEAQAASLQQAMEREVSFVDHIAPHDEPLDLRTVRRSLRDELVARTDASGGFGGAPKFPRPSYVQALLEFDDPEAKAAIVRTLDAMSRNGLYDHLRGGFARYSVDDQWHVPHFEKMLSDQALLARAYFQAARRFKDRPEWRDVALNTLDFVVADLAVELGFASSLDADAGGVEGSHVTWDVNEVAQTLSDVGLSGDLTRVLTRWRIMAPGAFEGRSIPRLAPGEPFLCPEELRPAREALLAARARRNQPGRDDKVILEWNAMFASACLMSAESVRVELAFSLLRSLRRSHYSESTWWRTEQRTSHATASDVAWLCDAHLDAFEVTGDDQWLREAFDLGRYLLSHYWDGSVPTALTPDQGQGLFSQSDLVRDLATRPKEIFDGATPASHAVACRALARLGLCLSDENIIAAARRLVELAASLLATHPSAAPDLVEASGFALEGVEVVVPGETNDLSDHVRLSYMVRSVLITGDGASPLLEDRQVGLAYVCRDGSCLLPASTVAQLDDRLRESTR